MRKLLTDQYSQGVTVLAVLGIGLTLLTGRPFEWYDFLLVLVTYWVFNIVTYTVGHALAVRRARRDTEDADS